MRQQDMIRGTIIRGGTSKAVFIKANELPRDPAVRDSVILKIFGSPDIRQIDGLGGSDITTSKVGLIAPPTRPDADVDYTFGQVQLTQAAISWSSNCGNISAAVGPYAIDEGMVCVTEPHTTVRIHNTNTGKILIATVEVKDGCAAVDGDYALDGVPGTGSPIVLDYSLTYGSATGKLLPTGNPVDTLQVDGYGAVSASIVDIANSVCFVRAEDVGARGDESRPEIAANPALTQKLEAIRAAAAEACGFIGKGENAVAKSPLRPMIAFVSPAKDYIDYASNKSIKGSDVDFLSRILYNQMPVETYTGTGTICTTVAARIPGTLVNQVCRPAGNAFVRMGHPRGVNLVEVAVERDAQGFVVKKASFTRTARRIMDGVIYIKKQQ